MKELFVIVWKESKEILTPDTFKKYWPSYGAGGSGLHGWRPPKKVYYKPGLARTGFSHIPDAIKPFVEIAKFTFESVKEDGATLAVKQKEARAKKEAAREKAAAEYRMRAAEENLKRAQQEVNRLKNKR